MKLIIFDAIFPTPCSLLCSLLPAPCSLFPAPCSLLPVPCSLFPVPCSAVDSKPKGPELRM
ncbi:MAG: hypothetical protein F6K26_25360 [Moorea sp. SIO2I5]|nr:hypothetical protein [Moorena sp. SIO2I5]